MAKVTQAFFSTDATGTLPGFGTVSRRQGGTSTVSLNSGGNPAPARDTPEERAGFAAARAAWLAIEPTRIRATYGYRWVRIPRWPDFARDWYAVNGSWVH